MKQMPVKETAKEVSIPKFPGKKKKMADLMTGYKLKGSVK